MRSNQETC